ncbi:MULTISPECIES: phosphatidylserine decarboxylase family protein [Prolixibacter]|jgi:phosphatidylserine decarboxylase|uniref:Phosphatidylserine decarboxylase proenzyme n=1 Tax=Prolixibacter denitrificans TaxID=1541063 RepID=A0A2P8CK33_9BACT|nr:MULTISPECIES: phosphatidylserine decarboxylase family protein [Prolixibacter]PSK85305.1 phosphatidylserine decarboxylase [Prolixibacter denitrificans]GET19927.1 phosphatidylserine decarboxylase proenzyme [Prolixibacter denitrificans]GET30983.1 phosphatidylserine decarboxylase proenzyme [Prolixibacter sp. SD074]
MRIHKEGYAIIAVAVLIWALLNGLVWESGEPYFFAFMLLISTSVLVFTIRFFRYPDREINRGNKTILAPADGLIVAIEETTETEYFQDRRLQVSVFMSLFNVHANWLPVAGKIKYVKHHKGRYMSAYLPKSSTDNERTTTVIQMEDGTEILVRQIAGAMAKRVVTYAKEGDTMDQGGELGFIKFGSRVDLFLPVGTEITADMCEAVTGSQTVLAKLK